MVRAFRQQYYGEGTQTAGAMVRALSRYYGEGTQTAGTYDGEALKAAGTMVKALRQLVLW